MRSRLARVLETGAGTLSRSGLLARLTAAVLGVIALFTAFSSGDPTRLPSVPTPVREGQLLAIARSFAAEIGPGELRDDAGMRRRSRRFGQPDRWPRGRPSQAPVHTGAARRPTSTLSGGERTRLQLLLLMLGGANLLVLDEPTNHLDIDSVEVLEAELERFSGTVVAISHDRYFLDRIADRIVEVVGGDVRLNEGGYSDWVRARQRAESGPVREYLGS